MKKKKTTGEKLLHLRGARTLERVATDNGISVSALSMYEQNLRTPRDEVKVKLARYYGTTVGELFFS
jgi:transcriptional regulator with XRE-family HTH domain